MSSKYTAPLAGEQKTVMTADGTALHTVSCGEGRPVMLAHGYAIDCNEWNLIAANLVARGHRVIAFDQRGHGRSTIGRDGIGSKPMADDYATVLEHYDVRGATLVAHSMGGFLAIRFLLEHPAVVKERIRALVLVATFAGDVNRQNQQNRLQIPLIRTGILPWLVRFDAFALPFARTLIGVEQDLDQARAFVAIFRQQRLAALTPILRAMVDESRYDRLGELRLPCTILVGTEDKTTPPFHTDDLHAGIAGSKLVRIPGKGHLVNWEAPDLIADEIAAL